MDSAFVPDPSVEEAIQTMKVIWDILKAQINEFNRIAAIPHRWFET